MAGDQPDNPPQERPASSHVDAGRDSSTGRGARRMRLAAAARHLREGRPPTTGGAPGDPELVALVEDPFTSVDDGHRRLSDLQGVFEARDDRRAVFLSIYERVTGTVTDRIDREGFEDPAWTADYLVTFANHYRRAVHRYETGNLRDLPDPWQLAFESADRGESLAIQDAVLGINAHINYDLALALDEVGVTSDRRAKYRDHRSVTDVLRGLVDETQDSLVEAYAPGLEVVDEGLGRLDEGLTIFTIAQCRDSAWRNAVAMNSRLPPRRRLARWLTRATATGIAHLVLSSRASLAVHGELQELEATPPGQPTTGQE